MADISNAVAVIIISPPTAEDPALTGTVMAPGLSRLTPAQMGVIGTAHVTLASLAEKITADMEHKQRLEFEAAFAAIVAHGVEEVNRG